MTSPSHPLDIGAIATLLLWNLEDVPDDQGLILSALRILLRASGINDVSPLRVRKISGETILGQVKAQPQRSLQPAALIEFFNSALSEWALYPQLSQSPDIVGAPGEEEVEGSLLKYSDLNLSDLQTDLAVKRSARAQNVQLIKALKEGLLLDFNPLERNSSIRYAIARDNDSLQAISVRYFSSSSKWKAIAEINSIEYPYAIVVGQKIRLPDS